MRAKFLTLSILSTTMLLLACNGDDLDIKDGTYKGTFTVTYSSGTETGQTTLELKNGTFSCSGNPNRIPAGGSGTFSSHPTKMTFKDENFWTAEFDWNLILNGAYNYSFDGKNLILWADRKDLGHYEYNLKKQ